MFNKTFALFNCKHTKGGWGGEGHNLTEIMCKSFLTTYTVTSYFKHCTGISVFMPLSIKRVF